MVVKLSRHAAPRAVHASQPNPLQLAGTDDPQPDGAGCFPRRLRLLSADEYQQVFAGACKAGNSQFTILARANGLGYPRLGMAISRKAIRLAVQRNRIKRLLREYFRLNKHALDSVDLVILAKPAAAKLDKQTLRNNIQHGFKQLARRCLSAETSPDPHP